MTSLLVTGYKSFELGIFKDKDPKVTIIKKAIKFSHYVLPPNNFSMISK